jgi:hypothetical protein
MSLSLILLTTFILSSLIAGLLCQYIDRGSLAGLCPQDAYLITVSCFALVMIGIALGVSK